MAQEYGALLSNTDRPETPTLSGDIRAQSIWTMYDESFWFLNQRKLRQVSQLILLNNLQKGDESIASTLLVTLLNRITANLYDDKMQVKFVPGEEMDQKKVDSLNILAQNDYREMEKDKLDYDAVWDTLFFGRGYIETYEFDTTRKLMVPRVINPLVFGYDPYFEDKKDWRYYWYWMAKSRVEIDRLIKAGKITGIQSANEIPNGMDPYLWNYKIRRDQARKGVAVPPSTFNTDVYQILNFKGYDEDGDKCCYWVDKNFSKILYKEKLDLKDSPDGKGSEWPIVVKEAFREPHASITFSVADLLDDKHRAKSVLMNLAFLAAKDKANPIYGYNPDKVKDVTQLMSRQISQHIPMESQDAVWPLNTENPMDPGLVAFIQFISQEASDPLGTGISMNPTKKGTQTATESAINQQMNDLAQSLQSKVLQFGEKEFWLHWLKRYQRFTKDGDYKIATITGVKGLTFENINLGDMHTNFPPGVLIFSAKEAEYKELVLRRDLMEMYPALQASMDPDGMRNFNKFFFFPKFTNDPTLIDNLFPKTLDEIKAEGENDLFGKDPKTLPPVADTDDHRTHLLIHQMAPKNWATWTHMAWHEELLAQQIKMQQMAAEMQMMMSPQGNLNPLAAGGSTPGRGGGGQGNQQMMGVPGQQQANTQGKQQDLMNAPSSLQTSQKPEANLTSNMKTPR